MLPVPDTTLSGNLRNNFNININIKVPLHFRTDWYMTRVFRILCTEPCNVKPTKMLGAPAYGRRKLLCVRRSALCISHPRLSRGGAGARTLIQTGYRVRPRSAAICRDRKRKYKRYMRRCGVIFFPICFLNAVAHVSLVNRIRRCVSIGTPLRVIFFIRLPRASIYCIIDVLSDCALFMCLLHRYDDHSHSPRLTACSLLLVPVLHRCCRCVGGPAFCCLLRSLSV